MLSNNPYIYVISEDLVFIKLIEVMFNNKLIEPQIESISSFIELKEKRFRIPTGIILLDDHITGASSLEVITFLRYNRRLECPIYLFCESASDFSDKAMQRGANHCFFKPFKPRLVVNEIIDNLK